MTPLNYWEVETSGANQGIAFLGRPSHNRVGEGGISWVMVM